jgi:hypothetical protein
MIGIMKRIRLALMSLGVVVMFGACGSGDTGEGYAADTTSLNPTSGMPDSTVTPAAGDRGNPQNTIGGDTILNSSGREIEAKAPDSNATNPNVRR